MAIKKLKNKESFEAAIKTGVTLVDFNAPWCGPCKAQKPILEKLAGRFEGKAGITEMDVDENQDVAARYFVQSIPTLIVFKDGKEAKRFIGLQAEQVLEGALNASLK